MFPRGCGGRQSGQGNVEYVGMVVAVGVLLVGLVAVFPSIGDSVTCKLSRAIASLTGGSADCSDTGGTVETKGEKNDADHGKPAPAPLAQGCLSVSEPCPRPLPQPHHTYPGLPYGLEPNYSMVQTLQLTQQGRDALKWLADNNVRVEIDGDPGADYANRRIHIGSGAGLTGDGYGPARTLIHEANHARFDVEDRTADPKKLSRADFISAMIDEEVWGIVREHWAAREFRNAGYSMPDPFGSDLYDRAYTQARSQGKSHRDAQKEGRDALSQLFYSGTLRTADNGDSYIDRYGRWWDSVDR